MDEAEEENKYEKVDEVEEEMRKWIGGGGEEV